MSLYINDDAWCFFANRSGAPWHSPIVETMDEAGLKRHIDYYAVPGVTGILFNPNAMRAFFDSRAFEPLWKGLEEGDDGKARYQGRELETRCGAPEDFATLCRNVKALFQNVKDPYRFRYDYCRKKGVEMWISMRMNDVHYADDPTRIMHGELWRDHPEYRRAAYKEKYSFWFSQCLDYGEKAVWDHHFTLVREYFERFEMDGFELDWMRSPFYFKPGFAEPNCGLLTEFMRGVKHLAREAAGRRGHPVKINVRVPSHPEEALYAGLDVVNWCREGLADMVTPSPYFQTSESGLPVKLWRRLLPDGVALLPCLEQHVGSSLPVRMKSTPEIDTGFASSYYQQGADGIYLFNHLYRDSINDWESQRKLYTCLGSAGALSRKSRRHVATYHECMVEGISGRAAFDDNIPANGSVSIRLNGGSIPAGSESRVLLGTAVPLPGSAEIRLNTVVCMPAPPPAPLPLPEVPLELNAFSVPAGTLHDGENLIEIINRSDAEIRLRWAEIHIRVGE